MPISGDITEIERCDRPLSDDRLNQKRIAPKIEHASLPSVQGTVSREQCPGNSVQGTVSREQCPGNSVQAPFPTLVG